jgi:hypothetical protein
VSEEECQGERVLLDITDTRRLAAFLREACPWFSGRPEFWLTLAAAIQNHTELKPPSPTTKEPESE